jgi:hypothetical protein
MDEEKDKIIFAIAFIKSFPTLKSYLANQKRSNQIDAQLLGWTIEECESETINYYNLQSNISEVALKNGYKS